MVQLSLVHVRSVVLWERARLRVYDLCAKRTGIPSFRKMLVILWLRLSEIYGILKHDHSVLRGWESFWWLCRCFVWSILFSGYPFRRRMLWNMFLCFVVAVCVEHLPGGVLKIVLYGEPPPRGPTPYPIIYHFFWKGTHFVYLLLEKGTPFIYLLRRLMNKSLKQEVFLSFFSRSA